MSFVAGDVLRDSAADGAVTGGQAALEADLGRRDAKELIGVDPFAAVEAVCLVVVASSLAAVDSRACSSPHNGLLCYRGSNSEADQSEVDDLHIVDGMVGGCCCGGVGTWEYSVLVSGSVEYCTVGVGMLV